MRLSKIDQINRVARLFLYKIYRRLRMRVTKIDRINRVENMLLYEIRKNFKQKRYNKLSNQLFLQIYHK